MFLALLSAFIQPVQALDGQCPRAMPRMDVGTIKPKTFRPEMIVYLCLSVSYRAHTMLCPYLRCHAALL